MATNKNRNASEYFNRVALGKNPLRYSYGATVGLYNILPDQKYPHLEEQDLPIYWRRAADEYLWLCQIRKDSSSDSFLNVGNGDPLLGYASSCGNSLSQTIESVYDVIDNLSFKELLYRPKSDFLSKDYPTSILNRFDAINKVLFNVDKTNLTTAA